eukprot:tig00000808_g4389.t1
MAWRRYTLSSASAAAFPTARSFLEARRLGAGSAAGRAVLCHLPRWPNAAPSLRAYSAGAADNATAKINSVAQRAFLQERAMLSNAQIDELLKEHPTTLDFDVASAGRVLDLLEGACTSRVEGQNVVALQGLDSEASAVGRAKHSEREAAGRAKRLHTFIRHRLHKREPEQIVERLEALREVAGEAGLAAILRVQPSLLVFTPEGVWRMVEQLKGAGFTAEQIQRLARTGPKAMVHARSLGERLARLAEALGCSEAEARERGIDSPQLLWLKVDTNIKAKVQGLRALGFEAGQVERIARGWNFGTAIESVAAMVDALASELFAPPRPPAGPARPRPPGAAAPSEEARAAARAFLAAHPMLLERRVGTLLENARRLRGALPAPTPPPSPSPSPATPTPCAPASRAGGAGPGLRALGLEEEEIGRGEDLLVSSWEARVVPRLVARRLFGLEGRLKSAHSLVKSYTDARLAARLGLAPEAYARFVRSCAFLLRAGVPAPALYALPLPALDAGPRRLHAELAAFRRDTPRAGEATGEAFAARLASLFGAQRPPPPAPAPGEPPGSPWCEKCLAEGRRRKRARRAGPGPAGERELLPLCRKCAAAAEAGVPA